MEYGRSLISASVLDGDKVKNAVGEDLGHISDIMLDVEKGTIEYYVLSFGGFLELGDKLFAIPPEALKFDNIKESFILNVDKERLKNAPGFDKDNWPNMADTQFRDKVYGHYGYQYRSTVL